MKDNDSAFPVFEESRDDTDYVLTDAGMSLRKYAAIHLRVPFSGDPDINAMILESRRAEFAGQALAGICAKVYKTGEYKPPHVWGDIANEALLMANALLAELGKKNDT
jgi:hypothetical protein